MAALVAMALAAALIWSMGHTRADEPRPGKGKVTLELRKSAEETAPAAGASTSAPRSATPRQAFGSYCEAARAGRVEEAWALLASGEGSPPREAFRASFAMHRDLAPARFEVLSEKIEGDEAHLVVRGKVREPGASKVEPRRGDIRLVRESAGWRIRSQEWTGR
jgi:hypothetical protein